MSFKEVVEKCKDCWILQKNLEDEVTAVIKEAIPDELATLIDVEVTSRYLRVKLTRNSVYTKSFLEVLTNIDANFNLIDDSGIIIMDFMYWN